jgi:threonine dehydratase
MDDPRSARRAAARGRPPVTPEEIGAAHRRIRPAVPRTPTYRCLPLSERAGLEVYLKLESHQPTGVFKIRGAVNKVRLLSAAERGRGLVTASSGNHGLSVAYAAAEAGARATICVPRGASPAKLTLIRRYGGAVIEVGTTYNEAYAEALALAASRGMVLVHAFEDPAVIAGQGTVGLEILEDVSGVRSVAVPVGGGGLIGGVATAAKGHDRRIEVVGVQAAGAPAMARAWRAGRLTRLRRLATLADGLATKEVGPNTLAIARRCVDRMLLVSDAELCGAVLWLLGECHVLAEPSGAAGVAALLYGRWRPRGRAVVVVSGGNIAEALLRRLVTGQVAAAPVP